MDVFIVECDANGFYYESKSFSKICRMFDLDYGVTYRAFINSKRNKYDYYTPKKRADIKIKYYDKRI